MRGGALRNLMTIQRLVQIGRTELNEPITVWSDWRPDIFCDVEVKRGREHFADKQRYSEEIWRFRCRYSEVQGLDTSMRILHEDNIFDIKAPLPDGQRRSDIIIEATVQDSLVGAAPLTMAIKQRIEIGRVDEAYEGFSVSVTGGQSPYQLSIDVGQLQAGLSFNSSTGAISGTPTAAGQAFLTFKAIDAAGDTERLPEIILEVLP